MNISKLLILAVFFVFCCFNTAWADEGKDESGQGKKHYSSDKYKKDKDKEYKGDKDHDTYFHRHGYTHLNIPKGHYPPPGECRVWFPDRPAGHQPPPGNCRSMEVPPGAWLIRHPGDSPDHCLVTVYDEHRPGAIVITGEFNIPTGGFVRVVMDR